MVGFFEKHYRYEITTFHEIQNHTINSSVLHIIELSYNSISLNLPQRNRKISFYGF